MSEMAWLRQSSCTRANDMQESSSRVRRDSTSASAPEPALLPVLFCSHAGSFSGRFNNRVVVSLAASAVDRRQDFFGGLCAHFIAFWHVSTDSKVRYPER